MGWIGDTLKTIILVILLAVFIDLIIPGKAMQRYVKVVISLFILMTILQPVLQLLHTDFNLEKLQFPDSPFDAHLSSYAPLSAVLEEGSELRKRNEQRSLELTQTYIEETIRRELYPLLGKNLIEVKALVVQGDEDMIALDTVELTIGDAPLERDELAKDERRPDPDTSGLSSPIAAIQPVEIRIGWAESEKSHEATPKTDGIHDADADDPTVEMILTYMQEQWHLSADQVRIRYTDKSDRG